MCTRCQMMMFPNPQPHPTGDGANADRDPEALVYRPWQPDERKEAAETLPDPQKTPEMRNGLQQCNDYCPCMNQP